jgi:glycosyltransferase involved in cell wall biosynthesis
MRILFISADLQGGAGIAALRQMEALKNEGFEVDLETLSSSSNLGKAGLAIRKLKARANRKFEYEILKRIGRQDGLYKSLMWLPFNPLSGIRIKKYDIVHFHWINTGFVGLNHINRINRKVDTVWTLHSFWPFSSPDHHFRTEYQSNRFRHINLIIRKKQEKLFQHTILGIGRWIVPSKFMVDFLPSTLRIKIINNCLDNQILTISNRRNFRNNFGFVCAGDVWDPRKGLEDLLDSWIKIYERSRDLRLYIVGPQYSHSENTLLTRLAASSGVIFLGALNSIEVRRFMVHIDALLVPSHEETFGQTILEALSVGTPVIANSKIKSLKDFDIAAKCLLPIEFEDDTQLAIGLHWAEQLNYSKLDIVESVGHYFGQSQIAKNIANCYMDLISPNQTLD